MRRRFRFVFAGACAALAALLCLLYGQEVRGEAERVRAEALARYGGEVVTLLVATEDLKAGDAVTRQNVTEKDWLSDLAPKDAVLGLDTVLGAELTAPVAAGVPLTALNFRADEDAIEVPDGCVALSVPLTEKCALPASTDVGATLVAFEVRDSGAELVAEGLQVLRIAGDQGLGGSRGSVTLAVGSADVARVLSASAEGTLRLALPADDVSDLGGDDATAPTEVLPEEGPGADADVDVDAAASETAESLADVAATSGSVDQQQEGDES